MKGIVIFVAAMMITIFFLILNMTITSQSQIAATPNANLALEGRVTVLEGQVRELRRIVGIDKGLSEGLQNRGKK